MTAQDARTLSTLAVLATLKDQLPSVWEQAEVVGKWVWIEFAYPPFKEIRDRLKELGFHWNRKRMAWQHPCGCFTPHSSGDPRFKYGIRHASSVEVESEVAA